MKSQILKLSMFCLAFTLCFMSCDKSTDLVELNDTQLSTTPTMDDFDIDLPAVKENPSTLIATVQKDGHEIKFSTTGPPESQGILMVEHLYGKALENEYFITGGNDESTPFDIFLAMTDKDIDIPKSIAASAKDNQLELSGRRVQETSKMLNLMDENYTEPEEAKVESRNCSVPSIVCYPSYSWNLGRCDGFTRSNQYRVYSYKNGWKKVRKIDARISHGCGSLSIYFYHWNGKNWQWNKEAWTTTSYPRGKGSYSHWIPNLAERRLIIVPSGNSDGTVRTNFRTSTQMVK